MVLSDFVTELKKNVKAKETGKQISMEGKLHCLPKISCSV